MPKLIFDNWNPDYDIPDDPRPVEKEYTYSSAEDLQNDIFYKEDMKSHLEKLRITAMDLRKQQNNYWDRHGDSYKLEELVKFILLNREYIIGVVKNANWLIKVDQAKWENEFHLYYETLLAFIERSKFAISSYETQIKKLKNKLKGMM